MGDLLTARVKMQQEPAAEADRPRSRVSAAFSHSQSANRPFWFLSSKYTIVSPTSKMENIFFATHAWGGGGIQGGGAPQEENYRTLKVFIISKIRLMIDSSAPSVLLRILVLIDKQLKNHYKQFSNNVKQSIFKWYINLKTIN